jgi:predicted nucleotidyltransferase
MTFLSMLNEHAALSKRRSNSLQRLELVGNKVKEEKFLDEPAITVFCAGSLARLEAGDKSDLDLFVTADGDGRLHSRLFEFTLFAHLIRINSDLKFPPFSNDGEYLKIHFLEDLKNRTGSRRDDIENLFTVRMLLMLESRPLINEALYYQHLTAILENYYRDGKGKSSFKPLFLLNDLLRYWRTLCLNYEERRHDPERPWRKKNINLKFSRMLTVFGTVLPLVVWPVANVEELVEFCKFTPLERLATGLDRLQDQTLLEEWPSILDIYETFLSWKEDDNIENFLKDKDNKKMVEEAAAKFAAYFYRALTHQKIREEYRRYLVL